MHAAFVSLWIVLPCIYLIAAAIRFFLDLRKTSGDERKEKLAGLPKYLATVSVVTGLLAGAGQAVTAAIKFGDDYAHSIGTQRMEAISRASMFPKEADITVRIVEISGLLDTLRADDESADAIETMLLQFIRSRQSIDSNRTAFGKMVPDDVQAAIRVLGKANAARHKWAFNFRRLSLVGADFSSGDFSGSVFDESNLRHASFRDASLGGARFNSANFDYWCVDWAKNYNLDKNDSTSVDPNNLFKSPADGWYPSQVQASFSGARANGAEFYGANLIGVDFSNAKLNGAKFRSADLTFTNLTNSEFQIAELTQGCRNGPVKPNTLMPQLRKCSGEPALCGQEDIWKDASSANHAPPERALSY